MTTADAQVPAAIDVREWANAAGIPAPARRMNQGHDATLRFRGLRCFDAALAALTRSGTTAAWEAYELCMLGAATSTRWGWEHTNDIIALRSLPTAKTIGDDAVNVSINWFIHVLHDDHVRYLEYLRVGRPGLLSAEASALHTRTAQDRVAAAFDRRPLARLVELARRNVGLSISEAARRLGVPDRQWRSWEDDAARPRPLEGLARTLGWPVDAFVLARLGVEGMATPPVTECCICTSTSFERVRISLGEGTPQNKDYAALMCRDCSQTYIADGWWLHWVPNDGVDDDVRSDPGAFVRGAPWRTRTVSVVFDGYRSYRAWADATPGGQEG